MNDDDILMNLIAEEMWALIRSHDQHDWAWCVNYLPKTADDIKKRATSVFRKWKNTAQSNPEKMDLRVKDALIRGSL